MKCWCCGKTGHRAHQCFHKYKVCDQFGSGTPRHLQAHYHHSTIRTASCLSTKPPVSIAFNKATQRKTGKKRDRPPDSGSSFDFATDDKTGQATPLKRQRHQRWVELLDFTQHYIQTEWDKHCPAKTLPQWQTVTREELRDQLQHYKEQGQPYKRVVVVHPDFDCSTLEVDDLVLYVGVKHSQLPDVERTLENDTDARYFSATGKGLHFVVKAEV
eukprot:TRINITY_DN1601_c0_g1_i1.p1 TRINITY_DN1601_c0_g1~~TRINITY_DN1601_c0_g1_i1.p1  ORF type:complete len:215 (+),score=23.71 TRINITY_DN1601_c0_g1_i1:137-781(+)